MKTMKNQLIQTAEQFNIRKANLILVMLSMAYLIDYADRMIIASLLPLIKQEWNLPDSQLGMLTSTVNFFIAIFVLPLSLLVDRWSRRKMLAIMIFVWSISTMFCAYANNFNQLLFARAFTGIGEAAYAPASVAIIAMMFPINKRAKYTGIWNAFSPLGAAIGFFVGGAIGMYYGWRSAMGLMAIPGIILSGFFWFSYDYKTIPLENNVIFSAKDSLKGLWNTIKGLFRIHTLWFTYLGYAMNMAINSAILTWFPSYLCRYYSMNQKEAGNISGLIAMLALVGAPLGGYITDFWRKKQINARMYMPGITSLSTAILLIIALHCNNYYVAMAFFLLFGILSVGYLAPATAVIQDVVHPGIRAVAFGLNVVLMNFCGAFWSPILVGSLSDVFGLNIAFYVLPLFGLIASLLFFMGAKYYKKDLYK